MAAGAWRTGLSTRHLLSDHSGSGGCRARAPVQVAPVLPCAPSPQLGVFAPAAHGIRSLAKQNHSMRTVPSISSSKAGRKPALHSSGWKVASSKGLAVLQAIVVMGRRRCPVGISDIAPDSPLTHCLLNAVALHGLHSPEPCETY